MNTPTDVTPPPSDIQSPPRKRHLRFFKISAVLGVVLAASFGAGMASSAQAATQPIIPEAHLSITCDASHPFNILFTDVPAPPGVGKCAVINGGLALDHTSGILGVKSGGSIRWTKTTSTAEWGVGEAYHLAAANKPVTVEVYGVSAYRGEKFFSRIAVYWPKSAATYYWWTGKTWVRYR